MAVVQSDDPDEKVDHPRHYNQHPSGIECVELIEHLPSNIANAVKYLWRCGLKSSERPERELGSALWYTNREARRIDRFELEDLPPAKTDVVWRALAREVVVVEFMGLNGCDRTVLGCYLEALLRNDMSEMAAVIHDELDRMSSGEAV